MIGSFTPILYDFKRSLLRISTLLLLVLFGLGGIGISYLTYNVMITQYPPVNLMGIIIEKNDTCLFNGIIYDMKGEIISNAEIQFLDLDDNVLKTYSVTGNFSLVDKELCSVLKTYVEEGSGLKIKVSSSIGEASTYLSPDSRIPLTNAWTISSRAYLALLTKKGRTTGPIPGFPGSPRFNIRAEIPEAMVFDQLIVISRSREEARLAVMVLNITNKEGDYRSNVTIGYNFTEAGGVNILTGLTRIEVPGNMSYSFLGSISNSYFKIFNVKLDPDKSVLVLRFKGGNSSGVQAINYEIIFPVEAIYAGALSGLNGLGAVTLFFPVALLYLAYSLMAKPRSIGALEFVLARPVTRWDIYLTRYLAGVLTALIATIVLIGSVHIGNLTLLGVSLDNYSLSMYFLGIAGSLIAYYSFFYLLASSVRSGVYLGVSIVLYLLYTFFWNLIVLVIAIVFGGGFTAYTDYSRILVYFNPLCAQSYAKYYIGLHYGITTESPYANPYLAVAASLAWIIVPFILGYMVFKRINVSS